VFKKNKRTDPLTSLQFSQDEGLILIHSEYGKELKYYFTLKCTIFVYSKILHIFKQEAQWACIAHLVLSLISIKQRLMYFRNGLV